MIIIAISKSKSQVHTVMQRYKYLSSAVPHLDSSLLKCQSAVNLLMASHFCMRRPTNWGLIILVIFVQCLRAKETEVLWLLHFMFF